MADKNFQIANISAKDEAVIKKAETEIKKETGKDFIMIAWEENK